MQYSVELAVSTALDMLRSTVLLFLVTLALCTPKHRKPAYKGQSLVAQWGNGHPSSDLHVYWEGNYDSHPNFEKLIAKIKPGETVQQNTMTGHSFTIRSSDGNFRVLIKIYDNIEEDARQFRVDFLNLNHDGAGISPIELQHGTSKKRQYYWIDSGRRVTHSTDPHHLFTVRNLEKQKILDMVLLPSEHTEL